MERGNARRYMIGTGGDFTKAEFESFMAWRKAAADASRSPRRIVNQIVNPPCRIS